MTFSRLGLPILVLAATPVFAQKTNDLIRELQRDVATMQQDLRTLNSKFDEKMAVVTTLQQNTLGEAGSASKGVAVLDRQIKDSLKEQQNMVAAPVAALGQKVDSMSQDYQALTENVKDLNTRMQRLQTTLKEIQDAVNMLAARSAPPPPTPDGGATPPAPGAQGGPPAGVSAEQVYLNAMKDKDGGNFDLALTEFQDFLRWFPAAELAPNAQYYVGECLYYKNDFEAAIPAFDAVLEKYGDSNKAPDALYLKGRALLRLEQRSKAMQVFDELAKKYPTTEAARKAREMRKNLAPAPATKKKR
ncbi:MAG: tol-pal system protein YbgF [Bryobacterales bacterium]|nr:tol-pal system protein YbgF [Bryobacterales bacterium]